MVQPNYQVAKPSNGGQANEARAMGLAKWAGTCRSCGKPFAAGDRILFLNRPEKGSPYHPECVGQKKTDWTKPETTDEATETTEHKPTAKPSGSDALLDIITSAVAERISLEGLTDTDTVRAIAQDEADKAVTSLRDDVATQIAAIQSSVKVIELRRQDAPPVRIEGAHYMMPRVAALIEAGIHVYLWGEPGTGKTTVLMQLGDTLERSWEVDTLDPSTARSHVLGYKNLDKTPSETAFTRTYQHPRGLYIGEETDLAPAQVQSLMNTALANGHCGAGWGPIERGKAFAFAGNGNTPGRPTEAFRERKNMSEAFKDRLYFVEWPLDVNIERRAVGAPLAPVPERKLTTCTPIEWQAWVEKTRAYCRANFPTVQVSPRATHTGLLALACGETPLEVAHGLVFRGLDKESTDKILSACPLPGRAV